MASELRIKVSAEKYRDTINKLGEKVSALEDCLGQLQNQRSKLQAANQGEAAEKAFETIKQNEENVKKAIEQVTKQKEKIQQFLDTMTQADSEIQKKYEESLNEAKHVFD